MRATAGCHGRDRSANLAAVKLTAVTRSQGNNAAIKDGTLRPDAFDLSFEEVPVLIHAFRRMVRGLEWDVCEMAFATYLCAREHGVRFTAIPAFVMRGFHHGVVVRNRRSDVREPKDLEGRRVGVNRGYTVTTGVWARGVLQDEHGVDLSKVTWMLSGDEHVAEYAPPANVVRLPEGQDLADEVVSGRIPAAIALPVGDDIADPILTPLIADPEAAGFEALRTRAYYPINHLLVVRDEVLEAHPGVAAAVFELFAESKRRYVERLASGAIESLTEADLLHRNVMDVLRDPLPYGVEPNRAMIEEFIGHCLTQGVLRVPVTAEEIFAEETLDLTG
jgi:4,5-dihydroxyphthalate decarboxylase